MASVEITRTEFASARPQHPKSDAAAQEAFKTTSATWLCASVADRLCGRSVELWRQDEARVGQQGTLTRIWERRGSRPRAVCDHRFTWAYPSWGCRCRR